MKNYVIVAQDPKGFRRIFWKNAGSYKEAKDLFFMDHPSYTPISMWLRIRSF